MQRKEMVYILSALSGGIQITEHGQVKFKDELYPSLNMPALNNSDAWPCHVPNNKTSPQALWCRMNRCHVSSLFLYCCLQTSPSPTILLLLCVISSTTSRNCFRKQNILCYTIFLIEFLKHIVQKYTHVSHMFISKRLGTLITPVYQSFIRYYLLQSINHLKTLL